LLRATCRIIWVVRIHRVVDIQGAIGIHRVVDVQRAAGIHRIVDIHRVAGIHRIHRIVDIHRVVRIHRIHWIVDIHRIVSIPPVRRTPTTRGLPQVKQSVHDLRQDRQGNQQDYDSHRRNDQLRHGSLPIGRLLPAITAKTKSASNHFTSFGQVCWFTLTGVSNVHAKGESANDYKNGS
jgi:hypothetical protein